MKYTPQPQRKKYYTVLVLLPVSDLNRSGQFPIPANWQRGALSAPERTGFNPYVQFSRVVAVTADEACEAAAQVLFWRLRQEGSNLLQGYFGTWQVVVRSEDGAGGAGTSPDDIPKHPDDTPRQRTVLLGYLYGTSAGITTGAAVSDANRDAANDTFFDLVAKPSGLYHKTPTSLRLLMSAYADPEKNLAVSMSAHLPLSQPQPGEQPVNAGAAAGAEAAGAEAARRSAQAKSAGQRSGTGARTTGQQKPAWRQPQSGPSSRTGSGSPHPSHAQHRAKERSRNIQALGLSRDASWEEELTALEALSEKRRRELRLSPQTNYAVENRIEARRRLRKLHGDGYAESHKQEIDKEVDRIDQERRAGAKRVQNQVDHERQVARSRATARVRDRQRIFRWGAYFFFAVGLGLLMSVFGHCSDDTSASVLVGLWGLG